MLGVIALMTLLSGLAIVQINAGMTRVKQEGFAGELRTLDSSIRGWARTSGHAARLTIDRDANRITARSMDGRDEVIRNVTIPDGTMVNWVMRNDSVGLAGHALTISSAGVSPSYLVIVEQADGSRWGLLFAGLTGQASRTEDPETLREWIDLVHQRPTS